MASKIYDTDTISLIDGTLVYITPLKIIHLREFMDQFLKSRESKSDEESISHLVRCALIAMRQYYPDIKTVEDLEDNLDMPTIYKIVEVAAGISTKPRDDQEQTKDKENSEGSWDNLDLAKLEAEVFLLGIWKDYKELESSLSMPELTVTLESKRELDYIEKKFLAAMQGVDLDEQNGNKKQNKWEEMKARILGGNPNSDPNDIVSYNGVNAQKAGFGIGMGLGYEKID